MKNCFRHILPIFILSFVLAFFSGAGGGLGLCPQDGASLELEIPAYESVVGSADSSNMLLPFQNSFSNGMRSHQSVTKRVNCSGKNCSENIRSSRNMDAGTRNSLQININYLFVPVVKASQKLIAIGKFII